LRLSYGCYVGYPGLARKIYAPKNQELYNLLAKRGAPRAEPLFLRFPDPKKKGCVNKSMEVLTQHHQLKLL